MAYCGAGLPDTFCCEPGNTCLQLFNVLTPAAICCPNGVSCEQLNTISCNATIQANPAAPAHMLDTTVALQECGPQCCPLGYTCQFGLNTQAYSCVMKDSTKSGSASDPSTSSQPGTSSVTSATPATVTFAYTVSSQVTVLVTATSSISSTTSSPAPTLTPASGISSGQSLPTSNSSANKFPIVAILATLFPAIAVGVILVLLVICLKRRRERQRKLVRGEEIFGGPTPPSSRGGDLQISSPINRQDMAARTEFIHKRSASGSSIPPPISSPMRNVIQASQNLRRTLSSGGTLVPTASTTTGQKTPTMSLGPIFETPTRPRRTSQGKVRALFSSNDSGRSKSSPTSKYPSINPTRLTLSRSGASQETIDVLMRPAPHEFESFGSPVEPPYEIGLITPETTYSDVYRAVGISPTKAETRGRQMSRNRGDTMSTLGDISESDREVNVRFKM